MKKPNPIEQLNSVIKETVEHINEYTYSDSAFTRNRKLNAETTVKTILNMQGGTLNSELMKAFPDLDDRMTASAFEQAKGKIKSSFFRYLLNEYNKSHNEPALYHKKYRLFAIDGSDFTTPFNPKSIYNVQMKKERKSKYGEKVKPFCQVHCNILYDIVNRTYHDCVFQSKLAVDERSMAIEMLNRIDTDNKPFIVLMDRGYDGFNMMENCNRLENCYYVIRQKCNNIGIKEMTLLPDTEVDTDMALKVTTSHQYYMTHRNTESIHRIHHFNKQYKESRGKNTRDSRWDFEQICTVKCRVVKFKVGDTWEVLATNLNRDEFSLDQLKELYHLRWDIETSFRELKYALGGVNFHSKKDDFIEMELLAHFIMFNVVSRTIATVKVPQINKKYEYAIDFKMACIIVRKFFTYSVINNNQLQTEIQGYTNPIRPGRQDTRNLTAKTAVWFMYRVAA